MHIRTSESFSYYIDQRLLNKVLFQTNPTSAGMFALLLFITYDENYVIANSPFVTCVQFISYLSGIMILFTCLLICYNPRDDIEVELMKTGVMTEREIESIRELRRSNKLSFSNGRPSIVMEGDSMILGAVTLVICIKKIIAVIFTQCDDKS